MHRRTLLATLSATFGGFAGCNTRETEPTDQANSSGLASNSKFSGMSVPTLSEESRVTWYHESDDTIQAFVRPNTEKSELPTQIEFTFFNRSEESTSCGHWNLYKLQEDQWFHIGPSAHDGICENLPSGESETWTIEAAPGEMDNSGQDQFPYIGGGYYAAVVGYGHVTSNSGALVKFDGPPVSIVSTDDVTSESDGDTVTVTADEWQTASDGNKERQATLTLERAQTADHKLIAEQIMRRRNRGHRNLLAYMNSNIERVVLRTDKRTADQTVSNDTQAIRFQYANQAYRVRRNEP